jgi:hypothetical protein
MYMCMSFPMMYSTSCLSDTLSSSMPPLLPSYLLPLEHLKIETRLIDKRFVDCYYRQCDIVIIDSAICFFCQRQSHLVTITKDTGPTVFTRYPSNSMSPHS